MISFRERLHLVYDITQVIKDNIKLIYIEEMFKERMLQTKQIGPGLGALWQDEPYTNITYYSTKHTKQPDVTYI